MNYCRQIKNMHSIIFLGKNTTDDSKSFNNKTSLRIPVCKRIDCTKLIMNAMTNARTSKFNWKGFRKLKPLKIYQDTLINR